MRFLCLHGGGTNNRIFELQTAALRYELGPEHSFEFVEGSISAPRAKGEYVTGAESLAAPDDEFFAYFHPLQPETLETALKELHDYLTQEGPFDAVIAFSQGCALAASYIINTKVPAWKFVVLFSGEPGELVGEGLGMSTDGIITIPTLHCWGSKDVTNPERNFLLDKQCCSSLKSKFVHQGGHELPSSNKDVVEITHRIRRLF